MVDLRRTLGGPVSIFIFLSLASCATYQPQTIPNQFSMVDQVPHLIVDQKNLHISALRSHPIDLSKGLDRDAVAILAVLNNPDLKLARDDAGIAYAQAFSAGLLPDPQLSLTGDLFNDGPPGTVRAYSAGLNYDLMVLVTHGAIEAAAQAEIKKTDMNLLWQEWQVVAQARLLYIKLIYIQKIATLLDHNLGLFEERVQHNQRAYDKHYVSNDMVVPEFTALQDLHKQRNDLARQINQYQHDITSLLGLNPEAKLLLQAPAADEVRLTAVDEASIHRDALQLAARRPDLLALQSGIDAEDQRYRAAILGQFPSLNVGFTRARDSTPIYSRGFGVSMTLPLWNRNRGAIAIELATRKRLLDEYQQRLNMSNSDIHRLVSEQRINLQQLEENRLSLIKLTAMVDSADTAYAHNTMDGLLYANLHSTYLIKQIEALSLQQSILEQGIVLQSLTGGEVTALPSLEKPL